MSVIIIERFEVFTMMKIQAMVFWAVTPCNDPVGGPYCLYLQTDSRRRWKQ